MILYYSIHMEDAMGKRLIILMLLVGCGDNAGVASAPTRPMDPEPAEPEPMTMKSYVLIKHSPVIDLLQFDVKTEQMAWNHERFAYRQFCLS